MEEQESRHTGLEFAKKLRIPGMTLFLIMSIAFTFFLFSSGKDPVPGYERPQSNEYYAENLDELRLELTENVFPALDGVLDCTEEEGRLLILTEIGKDAVIRAALVQYFDSKLFDVRASDADSKK